MSNLWQNIINLYWKFCGLCSPALQRELEGDPEHITKYLKYNYLWLFTKVKICTSGNEHTSNVYYSTFMAVRTIFRLIQGRDKHTEAYY